MKSRLAASTAGGMRPGKGEGCEEGRAWLREGCVGGRSWRDMRGEAWYDTIRWKEEEESEHARGGLGGAGAGKEREQMRRRSGRRREVGGWNMLRRPPMTFSSSLAARFLKHFMMLSVVHAHQRPHRLGLAHWSSVPQTWSSSSTCSTAPQLRISLAHLVASTNRLLPCNANRAWCSTQAQ